MMSTLVKSARNVIFPQEILESIYDGYYEMDASCHLVMLNSSLCEILHMPESELIGTAYRSHLTYTQAKSLLTLWRFVWRTGCSRRSHEFSFHGGDGRGLTLEASATLIRNQFGEPTGMRGIIRNVTDRKLVECALRDSERRYRSLFEQNSDVIVQIDLNGRIVDANPTTEKFIGYDCEALRGMTLEMFLTPQDCARVRRGFFYARTGVTKEFEILLRHRTGRHLWASVKTVPIRFAEKVVGVFAICRDITEKHAAVEAIKRLSVQNQSILESVADGICGVDLNGNTVFFNPAAEQISGYCAGDLLGKNLYECLGGPKLRDRAADGAANPILDAIRSGQTRQVRDGYFWRKDGTYFSVEYVVSPIYEADHVTGAVLVFRDVTVQRQSEEMLLHSEKLSVVGQLAAGLAHEIRNPLTAIKGFLQLAARQPEYTAKYIDIMCTEVDRISGITNELLAVAKPQLAEFRPVTLGSIAHRVCELLKSEALMQGITLELSLNDEGAQVLCETDRIHQVLVNLLKNAMDAVADGGQVEVATWVVDGLVYLRVTDTGIGMDVETLKRVGEPFYTTKSRGTGLGVMVCQRIIQSHGGCIAWDSRIGEGTSVTLHLPQHIDE